MKFDPVPRTVAQKLVELGAISFSWEDRNALWFGLVMTFSPSQRGCFKVLWDNFFKGNLPIPNERILCGFHGETTHIYHYFKRHPAWKYRVIVGDGHGNFWLRLPSQSDLEFREFAMHFPPDAPRMIDGVALEPSPHEKLSLCSPERP